MKKWILFIITIAIVVSCSEVEKSDSESGENAGEMVMEKPLTRSQELTLAIREQPKKAELYYFRAKAHIDEQMLLLALDDVNRALSIDSLRSDFHALKGEILYLNREPDLAVQRFQKSLELDPSNIDALLKMAEINLLLRKYQECFNMANAALRIDDQLYMAYYIKGYAHYELGDSNLFVSSVQTALELNPDFFDGYTMLGSFYASMGSALALDYYNSALDVRPNADDALYGKAIFHQNQGRYDEAIELYEYMIEVDSQNVLAWYNQGYIWLEVHNDPQSAIPFFEKAVSLRPDYVDAMYNLGLCYERSGDLSTAKRYYNQSLEIDPQYDLAAYGMDRLSR